MCIQACETTEYKILREKFIIYSLEGDLQVKVGISDTIPAGGLARRTAQWYQYTCDRSVGKLAITKGSLSKQMKLNWKVYMANSW